MSYTLSNMLPLGTIAPDFNLLDAVSGEMVSLQHIKSDKATVIVFSCNHCPYVIHVNDAFVELAKEYQSKGVAFIVISSNDIINYPQDSPDKMKSFAEESGYTFPYLYDETQDIAKIYDAACTPDFYVFDGDLKLTYRGQMDNSRPSSGIPVTGQNLRDAIDHTLKGEAVTGFQRPSGGCNIKWKK